MAYLSVKELAELKGCSERNVRDQIKKGKIYSDQIVNDKNRHNCYSIPLSSLPEELQLKYYQQKRQEAGILPELEQPAPKKQKPKRLLTFEDCTEEQRKTINTWTEILREWQGQRAQYQSKTEFDKLYVGKCQLEHPELQVSVDILYRKWKAYKENDFAGMLGLRGAWNKGNSTIPKLVWKAFLWHYFGESRPTISKCYQCTIIWTKMFHPELLAEIPTERSFRRHVDQDILLAAKIMMRDGLKAFSDRCQPYVMRMYDELQPNEVWVADNHTLDIHSLDDEGNRHRLYLTAFLDAKTGVLVGWNLTETVDSQSTIVALRHGIQRFGIPKAVYFDNGREFTAIDLGGKGSRRRKSDTEKNDPTTILQRLGVEIHNALTCNADAKPIERTFGTVKNQFSRMFSGFCGGTILERPESLKRRIKNGELPQDYEVREALAVWIDGDYNLQPYGGTESKYSGMSRLDVWNKEIRSVRMASEDELNLMLMRSTRLQKVKRNGVFITIRGEKIWYMYPKQTIMYLGKEVYVRYDPADLSSVRIYNKDDKFLFTWKLADHLLAEYLESHKERIGDVQKFIHSSGKLIRQYANGLTEGLTNEEKINMLDLTVRHAMEEREEKFHINLPKNIIPVRANEANITEERMVAGGEQQTIIFDYKKILKNAYKRKE